MNIEKEYQLLLDKKHDEELQRQKSLGKVSAAIEQLTVGMIALEKTIITAEDPYIVSMAQTLLDTYKTADPETKEGADVIQQAVRTLEEDIEAYAVRILEERG